MGRRLSFGQRSTPSPWIAWERRGDGGVAWLLPSRVASTRQALGGITVEKMVWYPRERPDGCRQALERLEERSYTLGMPFAVSSVGFTEAGQPIKGVGYGAALYRAALMHLVNGQGHGAVLAPDACGGTRPTSESARRVWAKLAAELDWSEPFGRGLHVVKLSGNQFVRYGKKHGLFTDAGYLRSAAPADSFRSPFAGEAAAVAGEANEAPQALRYHLTDNPRFELDPSYCPQDNALSIVDRSGRCGVYVAPSVEPWVNGHGYWRPFVVEFRMDPAVEGDPGVHGRWGRELFVPASSFRRLELLRVIPLDAHAREVYRDHGWIESRLGREFDTGKKIAERPWGKVWKPAFPDGYRYPGPDARQMPKRLARRLARDLDKAIR